MEIKFKRAEINLSACAVVAIVGKLACDLTQAEKRNGKGRVREITRAIEQGARTVILRDVGAGTGLSVKAGTAKVVFAQQ